jgi:RNA polymerase sigma-70 factor (ECF subfamily)
MPGVARPQPTHATVAGRLRLLADLVNDALVEMGTRPVVLGPMLAKQAAAEAHPVAQPAPQPPAQPVAHKSGRLGRGSRALRPVPDPPKPSGPGGVDAEHAETWQLVHLAQAGDGEAFGLLYDRYVDTVFRFVYFRVNDRALAEDFTSETFLRALRRIGTISYQGRDIGAWFITIARNIVLDHMKSARHRLEVTTADTVEGSLSGTDQAQSTENAVLDTLASERLMQAVNQLGDEQRECVTLRFIQGLSVSETAAVMGKNDGAIKALQHRAVRKLADLIGGDLR